MPHTHLLFAETGPLADPCNNEMSMSTGSPSVTSHPVTAIDWKAQVLQETEQFRTASKEMSKVEKLSPTPLERTDFNHAKPEGT